MNLRPSKNSIGALAFALSLLVIQACSSSKTNRIGFKRGADAPTQPSDSVGTNSGTAPGLSSQFHVFDPTFAIDQKNHVSPAVLAQVFPIHTNDGSDVVTILNAASRLGIRIQMIDQAKISIRLQSFIFTGDESGYSIANRLVAAMKRGVAVQVIVDPVVNYELRTQNMYLYLQRNGIKVQGYELLYMQYLAGLTNQGSIENSFNDANHLYHDKILVTDVENLSLARAMTGGANIANEYFGVDTTIAKNNWEDQDIMLRGPIVQDLAAIFQRNSQIFYEDKARLNVQDFDQMVAAASNVLGGGLGNMPNANPAILNRINVISHAQFPLNWQPATMRTMQSRPRLQEDLIAPIYIDMIDQSRIAIDIVNPYLIPDPQFIAALNRAVLRGVKVRIVTNHAEAQEFHNLALVARQKYQALMAANLQTPNGGRLDIYEWGGDPVLKNGTGHNHAKFAIFDQRAAIVGSYNLDPRSRYLSSETVMAFENPAAVLELSAIARSYMAPAMSILVTPADAAWYATANKDIAAQLWSMFENHL